MINRITILGGSSVYIPEFVVSALKKNLPAKELVLFGKPGRKLLLVSALCQRLINKNGFPTTVIPETNLARAVEGAEYIINHVRIGGMKARMRDEMTPPQFDMVGSDSLGAGAISNVLRTLPVLFDYVRKIEEVNPKAIFINLTNPVGILVEALCRHTQLKVLGINDLPAVYAEKVAALLGYGQESLRIDYVGLHDMGCIQDVKVDGISRMSQVLERLETTEDEDLDHALIGLFRMIPTRATAIYFHRHEVLKRQQSCGRFRSEVLYDAEKRILRLYENPALNMVPELTRRRNARWYDHTLVPLIMALEDATAVNSVLCVPNMGSITDLPDEACVEIPVCVNNKGLRPRKVGLLPHFLKGVFSAIKESDRLIIEAVRHQSYDTALQALAINPFVPSLEKARGFLDRVIRNEHPELH